jgi:hypothetical protein
MSQVKQTPTRFATLGSNVDARIEVATEDDNSVIVLNPSTKN